MNDRVVIVEGLSGLGNRLRTISSALEYAKKTNRTIVVDWSDGMFALKGIDAFHKYFEIKGFPEKKLEQLNIASYFPNHVNMEMLGHDIRDSHKWYEIKPFVVRKSTNLFLNLLGAIKCESLRYRIGLKTKHYKLRKDETKMIPFGDTLVRNISEDAVIYLDNVPKYKKQTMRDTIQIKNNIETMVNQFVNDNDLKEKSIGLHIRATDKKYSGSLMRLKRKLDVLIRKQIIKKIFLATDNSDIQTAFQSHYGDKVVVYPKHNLSNNKPLHIYGRESTDEIVKEQMTIEAIMDMFILSKTEYLLYQLGSTFSEVSKVYHNCKGKQKSWQTFQYFGL